MTEDTNSPEMQGPILYKFTNQAQSPELDHLLAMFYMGAAENKLGIMQALNTETDKEELVLVGVNVDENGKTECYPIACILKATDVAVYRSPDGKGGWFNPLDPEEVAANKAEMKSVDEAIEDV